jgi:hypothetical protein
MSTQIGIDPYHRFRVIGETDPCIRRHGGNSESMAAWEKVQPTLRETYEKILDVYRRERRPISPKEICEILGKHPSDISGRFTELKEMGVLVRTHELYKGSRCLELAEDWLQRAINPVTQEMVLGFIRELRGNWKPSEGDLEFAAMAAKQASITGETSAAKLIDLVPLLTGVKLNPTVKQIVFFNQLAGKILLALQ